MIDDLQGRNLDCLPNIPEDLAEKLKLINQAINDLKDHERYFRAQVLESKELIEKATSAIEMAEGRIAKLKVYRSNEQSKLAFWQAVIKALGLESQVKTAKEQREEFYKRIGEKND